MVAESISVVGLFLDGSTVGQIQTQIFFFSFLFLRLAIWANHITSLSLSDFICKMGGTPFHRVIVKMQHDVYMSLAHHNKSFSFRSVLEGVLSLSTQHALHGGL